MKNFFKNLFGEFKSYDLVVILISSAVGAVFSLIPVIVQYFNEDNGAYSWINFVSVIVFVLFVIAFIVAIILINFQQNKFHYIHMINNAFKKQNWHSVYTFGEPLSTPLWKMSKLSLRIQVAEKVKDALLEIKKKTPIIEKNKKKIAITEINDVKVDINQKLAKLNIDDLGYTNYILGNMDSKSTIYKGLDYAKDISSDEDELSIKLKGYRHLLAMCSNRDIVGNEAVEIFKQFKNIYSEVSKYIENKNCEGCKKETKCDKKKDCKRKISTELLFAKYALIKYNYQTKSEDTDTIKKEINELRKDLDAINKSEWVEKCDQLIWEIDLKEGRPGNNLDDITAKINEQAIFPNRFLKILNLFLDYKIYEVKNYHFIPNRFGTNDQLKYLRETKECVKKIIKQASDKISESEDRAGLRSYELKKTEFFEAVNRRIKEAKRKWVLDQYNIVLIDFDYTIFNYRKAQNLALKKVCKENSWKFKKSYADEYRKINDECWYEFKDSLDFNSIKIERVKRFAKETGINENLDNAIAEMFTNRMDEYMARPILMPGVKQFLKKCKGKYVMAVTDASKGRREKTLNKLNKNLINGFFSSEDCSKLKSDKEYFKNAIDTIGNNVNYRSVLVIGDGIDTDIAGAKAMDIDTCFIEMGYKLREDKLPPSDIAKYSFDNFKALNKAKIKEK
ncbi:MAG: HAD-IA family hydrolase [Clostridia bacterium]|nr:HAD-IA family hydrolase [Clostridia bacterium]